MPREDKERWVAGVDGCRAGWIVVGLPLHTQGCASTASVCVPPCRTFWRSCPALRSLPSTCRSVCSTHPRRVDACVIARPGACWDVGLAAYLRHPAGPDIVATTYDQVRHHGISRQAFGILPKIRQVDACMTPALQHQVYEAHPELAFRALAGQPMAAQQKNPDRACRTCAGAGQPGRAIFAGADPHVSQLYSQPIHVRRSLWMIYWMPRCWPGWPGVLPVARRSAYRRVRRWMHAACVWKSAFKLSGESSLHSHSPLGRHARWTGYNTPQHTLPEFHETIPHAPGLDTTVMPASTSSLNILIAGCGYIGTALGLDLATQDIRYGACGANRTLPAAIRPGSPI